MVRATSQYFSLQNQNLLYQTKRARHVFSVICSIRLFAFQILTVLLVQITSFVSVSPPSSLKVEYDKLANEKTEMQRHYVMVSVRIVKP